MLNIKECSWKLIIAAVFLSMLLVAWINLSLFPRNVFRPLETLTGGLINPTLQAGWLVLLLLVPLILGWGRLQPSDIGLKWGNLLQGILLTGLLWLGLQAVTLLASVDTIGIHLSPLWEERGTSGTIGLFLAQFFGNSLVEELEYRGFLLPQLLLKLKAVDRRWRLAWSIVIMSTLFMLSHIPNLIYHGYDFVSMCFEFTNLFLAGALFAAVYLLSDNLFLAAGVHSLSNAPTLITTPVIDTGFILFFLTAFLLLMMMARWGRSTPRALTQPDD